MGKTRELFKKITDTKGIFHAKMGSIKDRNGMDLTEAESESESEVVSESLRPHGLQPTRLLYPWKFPGKSPGVWCHCFLRKRSLVFPILFFSSISMHLSLKKAFLSLLAILGTLHSDFIFSFAFRFSSFHSYF